jgi:hypothetical protein
MGYQAAIRRSAIGAGLSVMTIALLSTAAHAQVTIKGVLYDDANGTPLRGTVMLVDPSTDAAVVHVSTDSLGQFSLRGARGTYQLSAVRPGYQPTTSAPIAFRNGEQLTIRMPIASSGDPTHSIGVLQHIKPAEDEQVSDEQRADARMGGFNSRRTVGAGLHYDRSQIERSLFHTLGEFLQAVPGFRVVDPGSTNSMNLMRNQSMNFNTGVTGSALSCRLGWFVDGHRMDMPGQQDAITDGLGSMSLDAIDGIEIFRGLAEMPSEFAAPDLRCGAVAVWTRRGGSQ